MSCDPVDVAVTGSCGIHHGGTAFLIGVLLVALIGLGLWAGRS